MTEVFDTPAAADGDLPNFLSVKDAATTFNRSTRSIRRWIEHGHLPACRIGNGLFVDRADIEKLISAGIEKVALRAAETRARRVAAAAKHSALNQVKPLNVNQSLKPI